MADSVGIRPIVAREIESISRNNNEEGQNATFSLSLYPPLNETEMVAVAEALSCNAYVEEVHLTRCLNGSPAAATSTFLKKIFESHPSIQDIRLIHNRFNSNLTEVIGLALKTNTNLKVLWLTYNKIGAHGAQSLAEGLRHNKALQKIYLGSNQIGDGGAAALAEALRVNKTLEKLDLPSNGVTMIGGKAFASALEKSSLKELDLSYNDIQDEGGKAIAKSICKNKSLTRLDLCGTSIGNETCTAVAAALRDNSSLRYLILPVNDRINHVGAKALEDNLKHMNYSVEGILLNGNNNIPSDQRSRITDLCSQNIRVNSLFQRVNQNIPAIPLAVWPRVLEAVECKPDLLFALLKTKPEVCREPQRSNRRRRRPDRLSY